MNDKKDYLKPVVKSVAFKIEMGALLSQMGTTNFQNGGSWDGYIYSDGTTSSSSPDGGYGDNGSQYF